MLLGDHRKIPRFFHRINSLIPTEKARLYLIAFHDLSDHLKLPYLIASVFHHASVLASLFFVAYLSERIQNQRFLITLAHRKAFRGMRVMNCTLSRSLDEATKCRFTVWKICQIDRNFIFTYIGTIVSFSTLIFQFRSWKQDFSVWHHFGRPSIEEKSIFHGVFVSLWQISFVILFQ